MNAFDEIWMVRAGRGSRYADRFREENLVGIGFHQLPPHGPDIDREQLKRLYSVAAPTASPGKVATTVGQALRFLQEFDTGQAVLTYDADRREYLLGKITSGPQRRDDDEDLTWIRKVDWKHHVARDVLTAQTRNTLGSALTLFLVTDEAAVEIARHAVPLDTPLELEAMPAPAELTDPHLSESEITAKAEGLIEDLLVRLDWEELQELVAGVLRAMGYQTEVAGRGPDRGVDIFASPDGLGLEEPRVFVEVKHRPTTSIGGPEIRSFLGGRQPGDRCLYVSTGGFTKDARYEADRANVPTKLIALPKLRELLLEYYDQLDPDIRTLVPLKRLYWPAD